MDLPLDKVPDLLKPFPGDLLKTEAVSVHVKDPRSKSRDLIIPIDESKVTEYGITVKKRSSARMNGKRQTKAGTS